ncbi:MAG: succinylglutamate desuccinylase [Aliiglaciecola sp.]
MLSALLFESGQFLQFSRQVPESFEQAIHFELTNGVKVDITAPGIIEFTPSTPWDKNIVLSCGVHGNETAPIEICDQFVQGLITGNIVPAQRVMFLFANLPSMDIAERFVEENMNRLFSGAHSQGPGLINSERVRAKQLEQAVERFFLSSPEKTARLHYDLHTAIRASKNDKFAVYPFLHGKPHNKEQLAFLSACGVNTILLSESPTTTFSYYSTHQFNAHGFTVELGKVKPFGENNMADFSAVIQSLKALITEKMPTFPEFSAEKTELFRVNQVINKQHDDFKLHFDDETPNFTDFKQGDVLASESGKEYLCEQDGEAIVFPNANVALGQRALLTVVPTQL